MPTKIAVGVITRRRPQQFATLLTRLTAQNTPEEAELQFIFVENDSAISVQQSVAKFTGTTDARVHFELESEIGISYARNRVLDIANRIGSDWLVWIDDDDLPTTDNWICRLYQGCKRFDLDACYGVNVYPDNRKPSSNELRRHGTNAIFSMTFLKKHNVRYNIHLPVGEDVQFGLECAAKGAEEGMIMGAIVDVGDGGRFNDPEYCFSRYKDEGMVKYGFQFRHLHVSNFHPIRTPVGVIYKGLTAILNAVLGLVVPEAKVRAARQTGIVVGTIKGSIWGMGKPSA